MPIAESAQLGEGVAISHPDLVNLYGCRIGTETRIGPFVEIQRGAVVGARCKVQSHVFICEAVIIADEVFVGHGVMFTNDLLPRATDDQGELIGNDGWNPKATTVGRHASIGSGAVILPIEIGEGALIAAGAVVTRDVPAFAIAAGNPARIIGDVRERRERA